MSDVPVFASHATPEMAALIIELSSADTSKLRTLRRSIRNRLFGIRDGKSEADLGLKKWFELQFRTGMTWNDFTFSWDISCKEPLKLIGPFEWDGQVFDGRCDPAAFTHQEK